MKRKGAQKAQDAFEWWVSLMPDELEKFRTSVPAQLARHLDFSPESLDALEGWLLERFATFDRYMQDADTALVDGSARYVGETFRIALGGTWQLTLHNPKDINFNIPLILGYPGQATPLSPHHLVSASTDRRTGRYLSGVLSMQKKLAREVSAQQGPGGPE